MAIPSICFRGPWLSLAPYKYGEKFSYFALYSILIYSLLGYSANLFIMADSYFQWEPPGVGKLENYPAETDKTKVPKKSFMTHLWDLDLIGDPQNPAEKSIPGIHPQWEVFHGIFQFVDPSIKESIAFWDDKHGLPRFYKYGFLWVHPYLKGQFAWAWSPLEDPFAAERGMYI